MIAQIVVFSRKTDAQRKKNFTFRSAKIAQNFCEWKPYYSSNFHNNGKQLLFIPVRFLLGMQKGYIFGYFSVLFITNIANESFNERTNLKPDLHHFFSFFKKKARQSLLHLGQLQRHQRNV